MMSMAVNAQRVITEALKLPIEERAEVIEELVRSLDEGDTLDDEDRERLHDAIRTSHKQFQSGQGIPADEALRRLPKR